MRFLRPDLAAWALLVPVVFGGWLVRYRFRRQFRRRAAIASRFDGLSRRTTLGRDVAMLAAAVLAAAAIVFALARPQARLTRRLPEYQQQDLIVLFDRSASMSARDILPSRSARATLEMRNFVRAKPDGIDRIALIGFADSPVVLSYLTDDVDSVLFYFDWIDSDPTALFGTDIGAALERAFEVARQDRRPTRKLFLIVSDGDDNGTRLAPALAAARQAGYRVHCIGVGSDAAVAIPLRAADGSRSLLRDDAGQPVRTRFSERTLREIAAATGGRYERSATGDELRRAIARLAGGEPRVAGWRTTTEYRDLYLVGVAVAALAAAGAWILS